MSKKDSLNKDLKVFFEDQLNDEIEGVNAVYNTETGNLDIVIWLVCGKGYGDNHYREEEFFVPCKEGIFSESARFGKAINEAFCDWAINAEWCCGLMADETWIECNGWNITIKQELD